MNTLMIIVIAPTAVAALFKNAIVDVRSHEGGGYEIEMRED